MRSSTRSTHRGMRFAALTLATMAATALVSCGSDGDANGTGPSAPQGPSIATSGTGVDMPQVSSVVAATAEEPITLIPRPGDDTQLWLAERAGTVRRMTISNDGAKLSPDGDAVIDISDQVTVDFERGLLSMAFSPDGDQLYLSYTNTSGNTEITRYPMEGDTVDETAGELIYAIDQPFPNHNGGHIVFGPDGQLWFGLGDGGASDDPDNNAQDPDTDLGKIIRIDPETGDSEIVVSGVRNPWRFSFDTDGSLWVADVGQDAAEEIDYLPSDAIDGANLGWSGYEGSTPYLDGDGRRPADPVAPVFEYSHDGGNCSITGGFVYRGTAIEALTGAYLFTDYCAGEVRAITLDDSGALAAEFALDISVASPISFGIDQQGEPYVLSADGDIVRLTQG